MPIPDFQNLNSLQFIDPSMYQQGRAMVDQAQQAADLQNQQATQNVQATTLSNLYNQQNNPQLIAHQALMNTGKGLDNTAQSMSNDVRSGSLDEEKAAAKQKWLANASEDDLKGLNAQGEAYSVRGAAQGDAEMEAKGKRMIEASAKAMAAKASQNAAQDKALAVAEGRYQGILAQQTGAGQRTADTNASHERIAAQRSQGKANDILSSVQAGKLDYQKAATSFQVMADMETDPAKASRYADLAAKFEKAQAANVNRMAGKPDLQKLGIDVNEFVPQLGTVTPGASPNGAGGAGNQVPPIANEVFRQDSGNAATVPQQAAQQASDISAIQRELSNPNLPPETRRVLQGQLAATQAKSGGGALQAPSAPTGRVVIYKDGKAVGSVPQAQVEAAKKQGYTLQ